MYPPIFGAYTELFGGLSPEVMNADWGKCSSRELRSGLENNNLADLRHHLVVPWGRVFPLRADIRAAAKTEVEDGTGQGLAFWEWCEEQVEPYL